jgi:PHD/YefM family antitoxin component YafN of YafNO toxin-antitoxin module
MTIHAEILKKNGKKQFAILPYEEFVAVQERLADLEDLQTLRHAKRAEGKKRSIPLAEAKRRLGLS